MSEKKYEIIEVREDGTEVRQYEDGALRNQYGHLLERHPNAGPIITQETARQMRDLRKQKILDEIEKGVMDVTKANTPASAIGALVARRAKVAMEDDGRNGNEAAKIVLNAIDAYQDKMREEQINTTRHEYSMDEETREILEKFAAMKRGEVIEVEE